VLFKEKNKHLSLKNHRNMKNRNEEYEALKMKALNQLKSGQPLLGKDGAFAPLLKEFLESALEAEMEEHLDESERAKGNRRNGTTRKLIKTADGSF
jgi:putative transposase